MPNEINSLLNDLPKYSKWPSRLLGIDEWKQRKKSKQEIDREYEEESWGAYLNKVEDLGIRNQITSRQLDSWQCDLEEPIVYSQEDNLIKSSFGEAYDNFVRTIYKTLVSHLPATSVAEFGCGFGSVILRLAEYPELQGIDLYASEYTVSGQELTKICAKNQNIKLHVGGCDFMDRHLCDLAVPEESVIFTCAAACTLPVLPDTFIESLIEYKPRLVIHFEPTYEHQDKTTLLGLMRKRYIEVNDYNRNLLDLIKKYQRSKKLNIIEEIPSVIGVNPLFPISIISWKPNL